MATAPGTPISALSTVTRTSMKFDINDGSNGGSTITGRFYQYSFSANFSNAGSHPLSSGGTVQRNDLDPGTLYYWRGRTQNAVGYSPWSAVRWAKTLDYPSTPTSSLTFITHTSMKFDINDGNTGGIPITLRQYQYSGVSTFYGAGYHDLSSTGSIQRTDLKPGTLYYWRGRVWNSEGASPWSTVRYGRTLAGAMINVNGIWKVAVPYVNVNGIWKTTVPYINVNGVWKATSA